LLSQVSFQQEPVVRIGIGRNISDLTLRSAEPFMLEGIRTRSAMFSIVITLDAAEGIYSRSDLHPRMAIEIDPETILIRSLDSEVRATPARAPLEVEGRKYRGDIEVLGNSRGSMTVVNELPLEDYLLGVVPNELAPDAFPELEALKAQAVAARTYIVRNLGQFEDENFDICATDFCQVYQGLDTEHPLSTQAVEETRGIIATYEGDPINALYSSTCGGRTENVENVFDEKLPYLVSTICHYRHPEPQPFSSTVEYSTWEEGLLGIAGVENFDDAGRFLGLTGVGEPASPEPAVMAEFIRSRFFPNLPTESDLEFVQELGILSTAGDDDVRDVLLHLILKKNAFEWQGARLISWDGETLKVRIGPEIQDLTLRSDVALFRRIGEERIPLDQGAWVGGESMDLRIFQSFRRSVLAAGALADPSNSPRTRHGNPIPRRRLA
jgi:hypothetical protein